jgi:HEAT repeat protein
MKRMKKLFILLLTSACACAVAATRRIDNDTLYLQALQLAAEGQFFEARELLTKALGKNPFHIASRRGLELLRDMEMGLVLPEAVCLIAAGMEADTGYDRKNALALYKNAQAISPNYYFLQHNLGTTLLETGRTEKAVEELRRSLHLKEDYPYTHNNLGLALNRQGRYKEAVANYLRAIELFPQYHKAYNNLGATYFNMGLEKEGQAMMKKALEINADYTLAFQNYSREQKALPGEAPAEDDTASSAPPVPTQALLETLASGPVLERKAAQEELCLRKDPAAVPALVRMLSAPASLPRAAAAEILGETGALEALSPLAKLVEDPEWTVRFAAVKALGALNEPSVFQALLFALRDPDHHVRVAAVCACGRSGNPEAVEPLLGMLNDPIEMVREACLSCLPGLALVIPRDTTMGMLRHERGLERTLAVRIVAEGKIPLETAEEEAAFQAASGDWLKLEAAGPVGAAALRAVLDFQETDSRVQAVNTLGRMHGADVMSHLYFALKDKDAKVRSAACKGLRRATGRDLKTVGQWLAYFQKMPESR